MAPWLPGPTTLGRGYKVLAWWGGVRVGVFFFQASISDTPRGGADFCTCAQFGPLRLFWGGVYSGSAGTVPGQGLRREADGWGSLPEGSSWGIHSVGGPVPAAPLRGPPAACPPCCGPPRPPRQGGRISQHEMLCRVQDRTAPPTQDRPPLQDRTPPLPPGCNLGAKLRPACSLFSSSGHFSPSVFIGLPALREGRDPEPGPGNGAEISTRTFCSLV